MAYLVDTNLLLRYIQPKDPQYGVARAAITKLQDEGQPLCIVPQNIMEFWSVCTRPASARGGLGLTPVETQVEIKQLLLLFSLLLDIPEIYREWWNLVVVNGVTGTQVHDARLVAAMRVHGVTHILTFNASDFIRYPSITVVRPEDV